MVLIIVAASSVTYYSTHNVICLFYVFLSLLLRRAVQSCLDTGVFGDRMIPNGRLWAPSLGHSNQWALCLPLP